LERQPGWNVCNEAVTGREAVEMARSARPDVVILGLRLKEMSGLEAARQIIDAVPQCEIVVFSMLEDGARVRAAVNAGVHGHVFKSDAVRTLVAAVESVLDRKPYHSPAVCETLGREFLDHSLSRAEHPDSSSELTTREREVLRALAEGKRNKEIAAMLNIGIKTVETHRSNIMHKLSLHSTAELVLYAVRNKIVES
jgi:DNA-binding NarL/FixJ family response regulator